MLVINKPNIELEGEFVSISARVDTKKGEQKLWYKFPSEYKEFLVVENLDAFLVGLLFMAMRDGDDIELKAPVSARLYYTITHYLIPGLCIANPHLKKIKINAMELNGADLNKIKVAGTGLSCGVDSFATYYDHFNEIDPYKIKYFTFLNAGSHGDYGGEKARKLFNEKLQRVSEFAMEEGLRLIPVDSNLSDLLGMNFQSTHTLRNLSCILNLQKLFRNYYYASPLRFDKFCLNENDAGDYDLLNVNMLTTESTDFFSSAAQMTRVERTEFISHYSKTYTHLDVCTNTIEAGNFINCTQCSKCMRTTFTLDLLGKLELYKRVFNLERYYFHKNAFIGKVIATKNEDEFSAEIWDLLKEKGKVNKYYYTYYIKFKLKGWNKKIKNLIKK